MARQHPTTLFPMVQFKKDTWEIDEFDCISMFLLIGSERAMLIDCGFGMGDLEGAIRGITDKPLDVVVTHRSVDHVAGAWKFPEIYIHPLDRASVLPYSVATRARDFGIIRHRQHDCLPSVYSLHNLYGYEVEKDMLPLDPNKPPVIHDLYDGQEFDLGGGRVVTAYYVPGHSPGHMMFLDPYSRSLFVGDMLNYNLGVAAAPVECTLKSLRKMEALADQYDDIYNGHHDFRALGAPLEEDCLPTAISLAEDILAGRHTMVTVPNFFFNYDWPPVRMAVKDRNYIGFKSSMLWESDGMDSTEEWVKRFELEKA